MTVKIVKPKSLVADISCWSNAEDCGYALKDGKRVGNVSRFKESGKYRFVEDFNRRVHSRENRPLAFSARTLTELKSMIQNAQLAW